MPVAGAVELLGELGLDEAGVRTAVSRYKQRGWLVPEARDAVRGYRLTAVADAVLTAGDRVIWQQAAPAPLADVWCVLTFSIPERSRAVRHQLRSGLLDIGFGNIGSAVWLAPARRRAAAERVLAELGLTRHSTVFVGDHASGVELTTLVRDTCDLCAVDRRHRHFLDTFAAAADRAPLPGARGFADYLSLVDAWWPLPVADPGRPLEVLGAQGSGPTAAAPFQRLLNSWQPSALAHAAAVMVPDRRPPKSPAQTG